MTSIRHFSAAASVQYAHAEAFLAVAAGGATKGGFAPGAKGFKGGSLYTARDPLPAAPFAAMLRTHCDTVLGARPNFARYRKELHRLLHWAAAQFAPDNFAHHVGAGLVPVLLRLPADDVLSVVRTHVAPTPAALDELCLALCYHDEGETDDDACCALVKLLVEQAGLRRPALLEGMLAVLHTDMVEYLLDRGLAAAEGGEEAFCVRHVRAAVEENDACAAYDAEARRAMNEDLAAMESMLRRRGLLRSARLPRLSDRAPKASNVGPSGCCCGGGVRGSEGTAARHHATAAADDDGCASQHVGGASPLRSMHLKLLQAS